jgi:hypothetical protein
MNIVGRIARIEVDAVRGKKRHDFRSVCFLGHGHHPIMVTLKQSGFFYWQIDR